MPLITISFYRISILSLTILLTIQCGSFRNNAYYSDGIYSDQDVVVLKQKKKAAINNPYSSYFDEEAKRYQWEENDETIVMTHSDSLNQGNVKNYQTNANWGGGSKNTQIIVQANPWNLGIVPYAGFWNYNDFVNPYWGYWNSPFNRGGYWNRFAYGNFYRPFYSPFTPFYLNGYYYGTPFFNGFGNGFGYAYNNHIYDNRFNNRFNNRVRSRDQRSNNVRSSSYRGKVVTQNTRAAVSSTPQSTVQARQSESNVVGRTVRREDRAMIVPNLVREGRRQQTQRTTNNRLSQHQDRQNRSTIERLIRDLQSNGYNVNVLSREERNNNANNNSYSTNGNNNNGRSNLGRGTNTSSKKEPSARRSTNNYSNSSSSFSRNNVSRSSTRSTPTPPRATSSSSRSSSSGSSSRGTGRRQ